MTDLNNIKMNNKPTRAIPASKIPSSSGRDSGTHSRSSSVSNLTTASDVHSEGGDRASENAHDFKTGERVWVNGTKPGYIKFIGKTQFAPGIWAGVLLDEPVGKNDGSVAGVKYFSCEPQRGIFARPNKLTRSAETFTGTGDSSMCGSITPKTGGNVASSRASVSSNISSSSPKGVCSKLRIGERVVVNSTSGVKTGILRFIGETDFAKGDWAGIELDEPVGKNDGSIAGKRYFLCEMKYGLFSPMHKVSRAGGTIAPKSSSSIRGTPLMRSGSRDSLSSSISNASRSSRVKLGVTSLTNTQKTRGSGSGIMTTSRALEEALKEKEQHIEQLLKERDLDRAEFARMASHYEEIDAKSSELQKNQQKSEHDRKNLEEELASVKRKLEDLQFQIEEETIAKGDLEVQLQRKNTILKRLDEFALKEFGDKYVNVKEIFEEKENLSPVLEKPESTEEIQNLKEQIRELEKNLKSLLEEKSSITSEIARLQELLNDTVKKNENHLLSLNNTIHEKDDMIFNLRQELNFQVEKVTSLMEENKKLNEQIVMQAEQAKGQANDVIKELGEKINLLTEEVKVKSSLLEENATLIQDKESKIFSLQQSLDTQATDIYELQNENKTLKQTIEQKDSDLAQKLAAQKSFEDVIAELKAEIESETAKKEEKILGLVKEIERLTNSLQEKDDELQLLQNETTSLNKSMEEMSETITQMKENSEETGANLSSTIKDQTEKIDSLQETITLLELEKETAKSEYEKKLKAVQDELKSLTDDLQVKKDLISNQDAQISVMSEKLSQLESENAQMTSELSLSKEIHEKLNKEKEDIINTLKTKEELISELEEKIENLKSSLDKIKQDLSGKESEVISLQDAVKQKDEENAQLDSKLKLSEQKVEMLNKDSSDHVMALQNELSKIKEESVATKAHLEQELLKFQTKGEKLSSKIIEKNSIIQEKEELLNSFANTIKEKETEISNLSSQQENLQQRFSSLTEAKEKELSSLKIKLTAIVSECEAEVKKKDEMLQETQVELAKYAELVETKDKNLNQKESEINSLRNIVKEKDSQFEELSQMIEASQAQLFQLKAQNDTNLELLNSKEAFIKDFKADQEKQLQMKEQALNDEVSKLQVTIHSRDEELQKKEVIVSNLSSQVEEQKTAIELLKSELEKTKREKTKLMEESGSVYKDLNDKVADMEDKYSQLLAEKERIAKEELKSRDANKNLEHVRDSLLKEKMEQEGIVKDREAKLEILQAEVNRMKTEFTQHKQELQQKLDISEMEVQAATELKNQLEVQHSVLEELQQELQISDEKCKALEAEVQGIPKIISEKNMLQTKLEEYEKLSSEKLQRIAEVEEKNQILGEQLSNNKNLLLLKEKEMLALSEQLKSLQKEEDSNENLRAKLQLTVEENASLINKIALLEASMLDKNVNAQVSAGDNGNDLSVNQEKELLQGQIDFLNSIIVDLKQKNEDLTRMAELQRTCWDESDVNLNDTKKKLAPRLFCDICDMFDLHDTDDCPKQESFVEEKVPNLVPQGSRNLEERPYCNNCEMFGHWTLDCSEPDTF